MSVSAKPGSEHISYTFRSAPGDPHQALRERLLTLIQHAAALEERDLEHFSVLDAGCGPGELLAGLGKLGIAGRGFDFDPHCIELASRFAPCTLGDVTEIDRIFEPESFDLVVCSHVLEHLPNVQEMVLKLKTISRKWILFAVPNISSLPFVIYGLARHSYAVMPGHLYGWDRAHFQNFLVHHCGLRTVQWGTDLIQILPQRFRQLRGLLTRVPVLPPIEQSILPRLLPYFSQSLIVLCEKERI